jgi:checkpoint serine/threonine-protein kinase
MLAPPAPGKRPEKLRFNLSLLFTEEGKEYSIQEARARSMGLLGKKWAPLPPEPPYTKKPSASSLTRLQQSSFKVDQNTTTARRKPVVMGEPTVTINTKEALADVFGMYNSPDKTRIMQAPGSKHAPLKKVEPITPGVRQLPPAQNNAAKTPTSGN